MLDAKYSELGVDDLKNMTMDTMADMTFEAVQEGDEGIRRDARVGAERVQARCAKQTSKEKREKVAVRRAEFLDFFKHNTDAGLSDRLLAVAEGVDQMLRQHRREAEQLPTAAERKEYIATHKCLIFRESLAALDILAIGLKEHSNIEILRLDGTLDQRQRDLAHHDFEEIEAGGPKNFSWPDVEPSQYLAMAGTVKVCAKGLTFIHALDVFILAPSCNPFIEDEVIARAIRRGQKNVVAVRRFYSSSSIESHILSLQASKRKKISKALDDDIVATRGLLIKDDDDHEFLEAIGIRHVISGLKRGVL
ncbi:hypothetical protein LTR78_001200 [Recurvomyces mirabilis]|uniref:Helicase C-terminal domain-containing protein n=1 Tax=Recurvomyces mirabilis TaxID=574656 RepID=A0AAE0WVU5_9PEZI|nr:hypothetical protein LTR78_001200 [Recurvomyces mirabilis]KAK5161176.1 hypothetical protein LTS14_000972 [Recurvomyces mirabilis]